MCEVESIWSNSFVRIVFMSKKKICCHSSGQPLHGNSTLGKKMPGLYGRLMRLDIPRVKNKGDISKTETFRWRTWMLHVWSKTVALPSFIGGAGLITVLCKLLFIANVYQHPKHSNYTGTTRGCQILLIFQ